MSREDRIRDAVDRFVGRVRQEVDLRLQDLATELLQVAQGDMRTSRVDVERAAVEVARAASRQGPQAGREFTTSLIATLRRMDEATTLGGILDTLADSAIATVPRLALFVVDEPLLRTYRHHGLSEGRVPADIRIDVSPLLASVVQVRQPAFVQPAGTRPDPRLPAVLAVASGQLGVVSPLAVDRHVVAVVYAEGQGRADNDSREPVWTDHIELLVRYAAARLENVTSQRTVEVLSSS